jgi:hypothetical protein
VAAVLQQAATQPTTTADASHCQEQCTPCAQKPGHLLLLLLLRGRQVLEWVRMLGCYSCWDLQPPPRAAAAAAAAAAQFAAANPWVNTTAESP